MSLQMILGTAVASIAASKLRSLLTLLGVVIGVTSVIALMSIGRGAQESITSRISSQGAELLFINVSFSAQNPRPLTYDDALAIASSPGTPDVKAVTASVTAFVQLSVGATALSSLAYGVTPEYFSVRGYRLASGRNLSPADLIAKSNVAVLGSNLAASLFPGQDPVGRQFSMNGRQFMVVGVLDSIGGLTREDDQAFVPLTTAEARLLSNPAPGEAINVDQLIVQAVSSDAVREAARQVDAVLRLQHETGVAGTPDFMISNSQSITETLEDTTRVLVIFLGVVGGISLVVGGIGIMNIMLVSVTERTREIGIRRAVGARRTAVLLQFLAEATVLSVGGGLIGVAAGAVITQQFDEVRLLNNTFPAQMSVSIAVLAMVVATAIGLAAGIYPAARAAALDPIDALRHE